MNRYLNFQGLRFWRNGEWAFRLCLILISLSLAFTNTVIGEPFEYNSCISADKELGDSAFWAVTSAKLYEEKEYSRAVAVVDVCFNRWGPEAGQQQKRLLEMNAKCPPTGRVNRHNRLSIEEDYLMNDVSFALWVKARSLDELGEVESAKSAYAQCLYMICGRVWDPRGWFWSPAEDCIKYAKKLS